MDLTHTGTERKMGNSTYQETVLRYHIYTRTTSVPHLEAGATFGLYMSTANRKTAFEIASEVDLEFESVMVKDAGKETVIEREEW